MLPVSHACPSRYYVVKVLFDNYLVLQGNFEIFQDEDGNHVWRTDNDGFSQVPLVVGITDYSVEARIRQVAGPISSATLHTRQEYGKQCPGYLTSLEFDGKWLGIEERDPSCNVIREGFYGAYAVFARKGTWHRVTLQAKGAEVRVYLNGELVLLDSDIDGTVLRSNNVGFSSCCNSTFDFDDIRVRRINP